MTNEENHLQKSSYICTEGLKTAARIAYDLKMPLLLTGEPGTGKTSFAYYLANTLVKDWGSDSPLKVHKFSTKSTSVATDLFYRFDNLRRFHAANQKTDQNNSQNNADYIRFQALGRAILETNTFEKMKEFLPTHEKHENSKKWTPCRSVVLIDEIDKAPSDFPNDLLVEFDEKAFEIPELQSNTGIARIETKNADLSPIIILTSNSEKTLPDAFLRRCVYHHIDFPSKENLMKIVEENLKYLKKNDSPLKGGIKSVDLIEDSIEFIGKLRGEKGMTKNPTPAELVNWLVVLINYLDRKKENYPPKENNGSEKPESFLEQTYGVLIKTENDISIFKDKIRDFNTSQNSNSTSVLSNKIFWAE